LRFPKRFRKAHWVKNQGNRANKQRQISDYFLVKVTKQSGLDKSTLGKEGYYNRGKLHFVAKKAKKPRFWTESGMDGKPRIESFESASVPTTAWELRFRFRRS
jgi:hypothetical protein